MVCRILNKIAREFYRLIHPSIWGKRLQINGIPIITNFRNLKIGMDVSINKDVYIQSDEEVIIGDKVTISKGAYILTKQLDTNRYIENVQKRYRDHKKNRVIIASGVWIASGAIVCPGVEIAENTIVAAGSVVVKNLTEKNTIYGGIPAKKIKEINQ